MEKKMINYSQAFTIGYSISLLLMLMSLVYTWVILSIIEELEKKD